MSPADADKVIATVKDYEAANPGAANILFYNKIYGRKDAAFASQPTAFLAETVAGRKPGRALDLGMGEGRNSIFLAQHGWDVTGIDLSDVGVAKARKQAADLGIAMKALTQDADRFDYGSKQWDLVCLLYFSGYNYVHDIEKRIAAGLKPGGLIVNEGPHPSPQSQMDRWKKWGPLGFDLLRLEYRHSKSDWGQPSFGRMLIQKT
jgi:SAM-dependent methyltransferase